jgi:DNA-binding response OmpR family regulator
VDQLGPNGVVLEIQLPVTQGLDTISALRDEFPALPIIVCSFHHDATRKRAALARGADAYLGKPLSPRDLHALLRTALPNRSGASPLTEATSGPAIVRCGEILSSWARLLVETGECPHVRAVLRNAIHWSGLTHCYGLCSAGV